MVFIYVYLQFKSEFIENYLALTSLKLPLKEDSTVLNLNFKTGIKNRQLRLWATLNAMKHGCEKTNHLCV